MLLFREASVPINSLRFKCLSTLAKMMDNFNEGELPKTKKFKSSDTSESTTQQSPSSTQSSDIFHLPIDVVQLIIDHITQEGIRISAQLLCALLSNGGCYSLNLESINVVESKRYTGKEKMMIYSTLSTNYHNLRQLALNSFYSVPGFDQIEFLFKDKTFTKLEYLKVPRDSSSTDDISFIFLACPNLKSLDVWFRVPPIHPKLTNNQILHSLRHLDLVNWEVNEYETIKLISLFPHLTSLEYNEYPKVCDVIESALDTGYINGDINVSSEELKKTRTIFLSLKSLSVSQFTYDKSPLVTNLVRRIVAFSPNLQELFLTVDYLDKLVDLHTIGNLKYLKKLSLDGPADDLIIYGPSFQIVVPILQKIGHKLEHLSLHDLYRINVPTIARYCPNLKCLYISDKLSLNQASPIENMSKHEQEALERPFQNLKFLSIGGGPNTIQEDISEFEKLPIFSYILTHALDIESIEINCYRCTTLTDKRLSKLMKKNPLKNLRVLQIGYQQPISKAFFNNLIGSLEKLTKASHEVDDW